MNETAAPRPRRTFLKQTAAATALFTGPNLLLGQVKGANSRFRVGVMGLGRGMGHVRGYLDVPNTEVAYVCDVDQKRLASGFKSIEGKQEKMPDKVTDFRRILDDPNIDAISIAAPNFWHAPATILACQAGKHVYVEKPGSYNPWEARRMVEIAKATGRQVQMGTQRRSYPATIEGVQKLREGIIGKLLYARCWYTNSRPTIGKGMVGAPPADLDWTLWQGPLPERPFKDNLVHYNWHWVWFYGGGELGNNGPHGLDIARWALGVDYPKRVTCNGGRYHYDDDQETPDTSQASYHFANGMGINWECSSCHRRKPEESGFVNIYGEGGMMKISGGAGYTVYDKDGKEIGKNTENPSDVPHFTNFAAGVREGATLNQPIADGQISTMLCHYGNIAYRTTGAVDVNPETGDLVNHPEGQKLWAREAYREGWKL